MMLWRIFDWRKDQQRRQRPRGTPRRKQGRRRVSGRDHQGQARDLWEAAPLPDATTLVQPPPSSSSKTTTSESDRSCSRQEKATGSTSAGTLEAVMATTTIPSSIHLAGNCFYFKGMKVRLDATNDGVVAPSSSRLVCCRCSFLLLLRLDTHVSSITPLLLLYTAYVPGRWRSLTGPVRYW
jgi:hypothetical protein